jgi:hypothetical protein
VATKIPFALSDGNYVGVDDVPRGLACGCVCPGCKHPLVARHGDVLEHHFAHVHEGACDFPVADAFVHAVCDRLQDHRRMFLPGLLLCGAGLPSLRVLEGQYFEFDAVELLPRGRWRIPAIRATAKGCELIVLVEHGATDSGGYGDLPAGLGGSVLAVSVTGLRPSVEALDEILQRDSPLKRWVRNRRSDALRRQILSLSESLEVRAWAGRTYAVGCPLGLASADGIPETSAAIERDCKRCPYLVGQPSGSSGDLLCMGAKQEEADALLFQHPRVGSGDRQPRVLAGRSSPGNSL